MLKAISAALLVAQVLFPSAAPGVDRSDAAARAGGNDKTLAVRVGARLFAQIWPAQVLSVYADTADGNSVVGLRVSGTRFHRALTAGGLATEIASLALETFSSSPQVGEVDIWVTVPLSEGKGIAVVSDVNRPSWSTVMSVSVRRGESRSSILSRIAQRRGVYVDQEWTRTALK